MELNSREIKRKIFINGLNSKHHSITGIFKAFEQFGEIDDVAVKERIIYDGSRRMFSFITYRNREAAETCLEKTKEGLFIDDETKVFPQQANMPSKPKNKKRNNGKRRRSNYTHKHDAKRPNEITIADETKGGSQVPKQNDSILDTIKEENENNGDEIIGSDTDFFDCY